MRTRMIEGDGPPHKGKKQKNPETNLMAPRFPRRLRPLQKNETPETNLMISGVRERKRKNTGNELNDLGIAAGQRLVGRVIAIDACRKRQDRLNEKEPRTGSAIGMRGASCRLHTLCAYKSQVGGVGAGASESGLDAGIATCRPAGRRVGAPPLVIVSPKFQEPAQLQNH